MTADIRCGTSAGYAAHHRRGEPYCDGCSEARAAYTKSWRTGTQPPRSTHAARILDYLETFGESNSSLLLDRICADYPDVPIKTLKRAFSRCVADGRIVKYTHYDAFGLVEKPDTYTYRAVV